MKGVSKGYHHEGQFNPVISQIDFQIRAGDTCAIVGPSGSGKSTLLNIIGLLDFADEGEYLFMGQPVSKDQSDELATLRKTNIGFVFQNFNLIPRLSVIENVALPLRYRGTDRTQISGEGNADAATGRDRAACPLQACRPVGGAETASGDCPCSDRPALLDTGR